MELNDSKNIQMVQEAEEEKEHEGGGSRIGGYQHEIKLKSLAFTASILFCRSRLIEFFMDVFVSFR